MARNNELLIIKSAATNRLKQADDQLASLNKRLADMFEFGDRLIRSHCLKENQPALYQAFTILRGPVLK